ncbi:MAG: glycosyltransferase family 39 protein [Pseudonocardia sp.]|nr:glycosyltransferase family 39 protein [Pseudonocardia sp.]
MLLGTGLLYLWNLSASGWANSFYAAAVQAGTQSWTAFLFGSLDSANAITVDKPPASLWAMEISARIFGFSSWSILVPQALMGVGAVALLWATVRRVSGPGAGLLAGAVLALTPVATLMFRFDNPDALLVLLLVAAAYCTTRAIDGPPGGAGTRWLALAGFVIGFAFLTKMMQAFLILPALAAAYGLAAPTGLGRRIGQMAVAGVGIVVGSGWWLLTVALWPAAARPYIGGSTNNSAWELALGYNGLGRIFGGSGNGGGAGGGGGTMFGGSTGITRMFGSAFGTQISWLLPAALLLGAVAFWLLRRAPLAARSGRGQDPAGPATRTTTTDRTRAALVLWGGWTLVTALTFSFMSGTIHPYYAVALAPGIAGLVAVGGVTVWAARDTWLGRCTLALASAGTAVWAFVMLGWSDSGLSVIRWPVLVIGVLAGLALLVPLSRTRWAGIAVGVALVAGLVAPAAYSVQTALTAHTGSTPVAGPSAAGSTDGPGGGGDGGGSGGGTPPSSGDGASSTTATTTGTAATTATTDDAAQAGGPGGGGQGGEGEQTSAEVTTLLQNAGTTWAAATVGSQSAASLELADTDSDIAVMAIGGFSGTDTYPTLAQFQAYVADGQIHYFVGGEQGGGQGGPGGDSGVSSEITAWVQAHYAATTVGGQTIYDLTQPTS